MYTLTVFSLCVASALCGYIGEHSAYHGPEAKPVVQANGFLADTHEVAAAKSLHLGALSQAAVHSSDASNNHYDEGESSHDSGSHTTYSGPQASPKVLPDGHLADTHEVSAAKEAHLAALASAKAHNPGHESSHDTHDSHETHQTAYHGPLANPVVLPSGHLADTHEVAAAKGAHLGAVAHAGH